jgi:cell division protein FtsI/penicillin-binding protein 2
LIVDRRGYILALTNFDYDICANPSSIESAEDAESIASQLSPLLDLPPGELIPILDQEKPYALLKPRVSKEIADAIGSLGLTGIYTEPKFRREYPGGELAAHVLGFVTYEYTGTYGVEGYYEPILKRIVVVPGKRIALQDETLPDMFNQLALPQDGPHLILTLDRNIQYLAEQELAKAINKYGADGGTVIIMDPRTGAILAMASYPSYDPNLYYEAQERHSNPAISDHYEPGSVLKVITMAAGLDAGVITTRSTFFDSGIVEVGGCVIRDPDHHAHGTVTMTDILAYSLNVGVAHVSAYLGEERFYAYLRHFGFGFPTGVDLYGEVPGSVKAPGSREWTKCDLATNSFGQGIAVTPLQMITAVAAVANRGLLMKPYIVEKIVDDQGVIVTQPTAVGQVVSPQTAKQLTEMLVEAVERGAESATVPGYDIAGKTGTAQIPVEGGYDPELTIASFVGYAPADDPLFIALVKINRPRVASEGAEVAAPVFRAIAERLFVLLDVPPDSVRLASR